MQGDDSFTFQLNKNQAFSTRSTETSLITLERTQKLDLLIHLISNLKQSLVISGPHGIGKTTLLEELSSRKQDVWSIFTIQATDRLSFESVQQQILQLLTKHYPEYKKLPLPELVSSLDKQGQKIVILIDNAGQLVPGLVANIIHDAAGRECLRVVFAMTQDEVHIKSSSDSSIDDCHFIEIPPLTEKQCGVFLQNLSGKPNAVVSFNAISDRLIEQVYRQTHGIPGKIVSELPKMSNYKGVKRYGWLAAVIFIAFITSLVLISSVFNGTEENKVQKIVSETVVVKKVNTVSIATPVIDEAILNKKATELNELKEIIAVDQVAEVAEVAEDSKVDGKTLVSDVVKQEAEKVELIKPKEAEIVEIIDVPAPSVATKEIEIDGAIPEKTKPLVKALKQQAVVKVKPDQPKSIGDGQWLLNQPKQNYTIQLMVLSSREAVDLFIKTNQRLKEGLKFFQFNQQSPKFVLIYGSFKNTVSATNQMKSLPTKYKKSWIRKVSDLQKGIKK